MSPPLLEVEDLHLHFFTERGVVHALNGVSFRLEEGEVVGVVGESGCGKSMTARCILRLLPHTAEIQKGRILFRGTDLLGLGERDMRRLRGARIAMIFQEPASALNPVLTIGDQIAEALRWHATTDRAAARERALEMLGLVGMPNPIRISRQYAHELSGGMQQRAMIAMALATDPDLLIADEPTTALDVTIQAQIMDLLQRLKESGVISSILFITHDFGLVAHMCDKVAVMYGGTIAELAPTIELFDNPAHPYTQGLFRSLPQGRPIGQPFGTIRGTVPSLLELPPGCLFHPRCDRVIEGLCPRMAPALRPVATGHEVACHLYEAREGAPS
jgi:oligopeptide/dipeptide ABC transporter ATP-binding protein